MNDLAKSQQELMEGYIKRNKHEAAFKYGKDASLLRKAIVRQRVLQKCLKMRRDGTEYVKPPPKYGIYGGIPLEYLSKDIDSYIERMHPRIRRLKKVQQLMQNSLDRGAILAPSKIVEKIDDFFSGHHRVDEKLYRDLDELERERDRRRRERQVHDTGKHILPPLPRAKKTPGSDILGKVTVEPVLKINILKVDHDKKSESRVSPRPPNPDIVIDGTSKRSTEKKQNRPSSKSPMVASKNEKQATETKLPQEFPETKHPKSMNLESVVEDEEEDENSRGSLILPPLRMTKGMKKALVQR